MDPRRTVSKVIFSDRGPLRVCWDVVSGDVELRELGDLDEPGRLLAVGHFRDAHIHAVPTSIPERDDVIAALSIMATAAAVEILRRQNKEQSK